MYEALYMLNDNNKFDLKMTMSDNSNTPALDELFLSQFTKERTSRLFF